MSRKISLTLGAAVAIAIVTTAVLAGREQPPRPQDPLASRWSRSFPNVVHFALGPDGSRLAVLSADGILSLLDENGRLIWQRHAPAARQVVISADGATLAAFAPRQPLQSTVNLFNARGQRLGEIAAPDAVHAVALPAGGSAAALGMPGGVLLVELVERRLETRRRRVAGTVAQLHPGPEGSLYALTRAPERLVRWTPDGAVIWDTEFPAGSEPAVAFTPDGATVAAAYREEGDHLQLRAWTAAGEPVWETRVSGRDPTLRLAADGSALLLAYDHRLAHDVLTHFQRRLGYFSLEDGVSWLTGGPYTAALPAALGEDGGWVVTLDVRRPLRPPHFRLLGRQGERRWLLTCGGPVLMTVSSLDGRSVAAYRSDGVIELVEVTGAPPQDQ